jgi:hypothetical protein
LILIKKHTPNKKAKIQPSDDAKSKGCKSKGGKPKGKGKGAGKGK